MKHNSDQWMPWYPEDQERAFAEIAKRRIAGLIAAIRYQPQMSFHTMLSSAYMQGARDIIDVMQEDSYDESPS